GEEGDDEVASRTHPLGQHGPDRGDDHRVHVLHVHGPAPPQQTVLDHACEGIDAPVLGRGRDHIRVAVDDQGRSLRLRALAPRAAGGSTGRVLDAIGVRVVLGEPGGDELSGRQFRVRPMPSPVLSVDADELAAQFRDLRLGGAEIRHWRLPSVVVDHSSRLSPERYGPPYTTGRGGQLMRADTKTATGWKSKRRSRLYTKGGVEPHDRGV